jgi:hypothetical protein
VSKLFRTDENLELKLTFSRKELKKETNDSTYSMTRFAYKTSDGKWDSITTEIRVRGNYRLKKCTFPPLKFKIPKSERKGTLFSGNKKLKIVFPCSSLGGSNDYVIKEYVAYKLYEIVSPYHYKARLADILFEDQKEKKAKNYEFKGIIIEDIEKVADRFEGKVIKRGIHPLNMDDLSSVQNAFFQYMIGNTDYSTSGQHNEKLIYVKKKIIPVPFDFDMSGLVNTNYAVVSQVGGESLPIESVTERLYRGFERDPKIISVVRQQYVTSEKDFFEVLNSSKNQFESQRAFEESREFLQSFFNILKDDQKFDKLIMQKLRSE